MQISKYVNDIFLSGVAYNGVRYAVPNNTTVGEYTYVCIKTEEIEKFGYTVEDFQNCSIYDKDYYELFAQLNETGDYGKFLYAPNGIDLQSIHYWSFDADKGYVLNQEEFSIFGGTFANFNEGTSALTKRGDQVTFSNLLSNSAYMENYLARKAEYNANYVTTEADNENNKIVVCVDKGGW